MPADKRKPSVWILKSPNMGTFVGESKLALHIEYGEELLFWLYECGLETYLLHQARIHYTFRHIYELMKIDRWMADYTHTPKLYRTTLHRVPQAR